MIFFVSFGHGSSVQSPIRLREVVVVLVVVDTWLGWKLTRPRPETATFCGDNHDWFTFELSAVQLFRLQRAMVLFPLCFLLRAVAFHARNADLH